MPCYQDAAKFARQLDVKADDTKAKNYVRELVRFLGGGQDIQEAVGRTLFLEIQLKPKLKKARPSSRPSISYRDEWDTWSYRDDRW